MIIQAFESAIRQASVEMLNGRVSPFQLSKLVDRTQVMLMAQQLLAMTYEHSSETLPDIIDEYLTQLPGGEDWEEGKRE